MPASQPAPSSQRPPMQHGSPSAPQSRHTPPAQLVPGSQASPAQHGSSWAPQLSHAPASHRSPAPQPGQQLPLGHTQAVSTHSRPSVQPGTQPLGPPSSPSVASSSTVPGASTALGASTSGRPPASGWGPPSSPPPSLLGSGLHDGGAPRDGREHDDAHSYEPPEYAAHRRAVPRSGRGPSRTVQRDDLELRRVAHETSDPPGVTGTPASAAWCSASNP